MFVIKLTTGRKPTSWGSTVTLSREFEIGDLNINPNPYYQSIDDKQFCSTHLNGYSVDKLRFTLKMKFNAIKYNDCHIYNRGHNIRPMIFENLEDAQAALEWIQSIQLLGNLTPNPSHDFSTSVNYTYDLSGSIMPSKY